MASRSRHVSRAAHAAALILVVTLGLGACAGDQADVDEAQRRTTAGAVRGDPVGGPLWLPDVLGTVDVWTDVGQARHLAGTNRVHVSVRFATDEEVVVEEMALRTDLFELLGPETKDSVLRPGRTVDLQVDVGPAICDRQPGGSAALDLVARFGHASPVPLRLPVPSGFLSELAGRECALRIVRDAVEVGFGEHIAADGTRVDTELVLRRRHGDEAITLERMAGSVVLTMDGEDRPAPVAALTPDEDVRSIPVTFTASRCDPHGVSQSQKTYRFSAWIAVGDDPSVRVEVTPPEDLESELRAAIAECIDVRSGTG